MNNERMPPERMDAIQALADAATPGPWKVQRFGGCYDGESSVNASGHAIYISSTNANADYIAAARTDIPDLLAALRAAYQREEMLLGEVQAAHRREDAIAAELAAVKRERDAAHEIDLRRIRPGYMGVCLTDEEDGIEIREVSHKHSQGRGYLDDDEDVRNIVVMRFAAEYQVLAIADRLMILAATMSGKELPCAENAQEGSGGND